MVNNTDRRLKFTDTFGDQETSIAINPRNPNEIVITAFSGGWVGDGSCQAGTGHVNAPFWLSRNGGFTWTKKFTINLPTGINNLAGGPCKQSIDFGFNGRLAGAFRASAFNIYRARSRNPAVSAFHYFGNSAQATNHLGIADTANVPWLLVGRRSGGSGENVYVAYREEIERSVHVAVAAATDPLNFTIDNTVRNLPVRGNGSIAALISSASQSRGDRASSNEAA